MDETAKLIAQAQAAHREAMAYSGYAKTSQWTVNYGHKLIDALTRLSAENADLKAKLAEATETLSKITTPRHIDDYHEDYSSVLWWTRPVVEAPWCGTPNDSDWPDYHEWWTPLKIGNLVDDALAALPLPPQKEVA